MEIASGVSSFTLNSYRNSKRKFLIPVRGEAVRGKDHQKINDKTKMKKLKGRIESNTCVVLHLSPPRNLGPNVSPLVSFELQPIITSDANEEYPGTVLTTKIPSDDSPVS